MKCAPITERPFEGSDHALSSNLMNRKRRGVALFCCDSEDGDAVDAGLKGVTGDLFAATTKPVRAADVPPAAATAANPQPTSPRKGQSARPSPPSAATSRPITSPTPRQPKATSYAGATRATRSAAVARKLPAYYYRLPLRAQRCYLASDAIDRFPLTPSPAAFTMVASLMTALEGGAPSIVQRASQTLINEVCRLLLVRPVRLEVRSVRPHNSRGELHGLFYPRAPVRATSVTVAAKFTVKASAAPAGEPLIVLWMRTAQRHDVVKPRTFLRTLLHELGHYLDYALLKLDDSYHSGGFYQRESFLVRTLCPADAPAPRSKK
jgi:hypothetical protein